MLRGITLSLTFSIIFHISNSGVHSIQNVAKECDENAAISSALSSSSPVLNDLISGHSVTVLEPDQQMSLYNLWSYLLYRWSIVLYFVPLIVIILCKCKVINCDVQLIYGSMPDDSV